MTNTFNIAPQWVSETVARGWGTLPTANNSSIDSGRVAFGKFQHLLQKSIAKGTLNNMK